MREQIVQALVDAINSIKESDLLSGATLLAAAGSIIAMMWAYGRKGIDFLYNRIRRIVIYRVTVEYFDDIYWYLERWMQDNYSRKYRNVIAYIEESDIADGRTPSDYTEVVTQSNKPDSESRAKVLKFKHHNDFIAIRYAGRRIFINKNREKNDSATTLKALFYDSFHLSAIFGKKSINSFLNEVLRYNLSLIKVKETVSIYMWSWGQWNAMHDVVPKRLDNVFLNGGLKDKIVNDVFTFLRSEQDYIKRGIPYKRGYLFYGPPGNGKTTLASAIASETKRALYSMNLSSISDDDGLINAFMRISQSDAILLIEDIDTMFNDIRKLENKKLNFSTLLNCLDGSFSRHGIISIMTTNYIEKLDGALMRKGRIDLAVEVENPNEHTAKRFIENFYDGGVSLNGELKGIDIPMSTIQELCLSNDVNGIKPAILDYKLKI